MQEHSSLLPHYCKEERVDIKVYAPIIGRMIETVKAEEIPIMRISQIDEIISGRSIMVSTNFS